MPMTKEEMLKAIENSTRRSQGEDPALQPIPSGNGWNLPIEESKPDPQAEAQRMIQEHIAQMKGQQMPAGGPGPSPEMQQAIKARAANPINPETGMPSYSAPAAESPEDAERKQQMQFKMKYLQNQASGGQR